MKLSRYIPVLMVAATCVGLLQVGLLQGDTWDTAPPAFTKPHDLPAQDLLNMRGADRPTPLEFSSV